MNLQSEFQQLLQRHKFRLVRQTSNPVPCSATVEEEGQRKELSMFSKAEN